MFLLLFVQNQKKFELYTNLALNQNLILVDTKYEFGRTADGKIILID